MPHFLMPPNFSTFSASLIYFVEDIVKMSEIKTEIEATMADGKPENPPLQQKKLSVKKQSAPKPPEPQKLPTNPQPIAKITANQEPAARASANQKPAAQASANPKKPEEEEDILAKFGVTFGYDDATDGKPGADSNPNQQVSNRCSL